MTGELRPVITGGIALIVGIIMVIIGLGFIPELVTQATVARGTANYTDYIGLDTMTKILPTFGMIALTFGGGLISFLGGREVYRKFGKKK